MSTQCLSIFCLLVFSTLAAPLPLNVETTNRLGGTVSSLHPGVTLDWWVHNDTVYGKQWGNASVLTLDLQNPSLLLLAKGLAPGLLRIGGSPVDSVEFDSDGTCVLGGTSPSKLYYCSQVRPYVYGCLTRTRLLQILNFGRATGLRIVLGLNACWYVPPPVPPFPLSLLFRILIHPGIVFLIPPLPIFPISENN
jgi:hypothetical protein